MNLLFTLTAFAIALGILIVIHEYGHYLAARLCGVKVLRFSIGFGRALVVKKFSPGGTEWVLAALPLGGYVKMLDEREGAVENHELPFAFNRKSVWRRFFIVSAGPIANFLLAIALYWMLFVGGVPDARPVIAKPPAQSPAAMAGLERGDLLVKINGEPVDNWQDARWRLLQLAVDHSIVVADVTERSGRSTRKSMDLRTFDLEGLEGDPVARLGIRLYRPDAVVGRVLPGSVAEAAGLVAGDRIIEADGKLVDTWDEFVTIIRSRPGETLAIRLANNAGDSRLKVTPEAVSDRGRTVGRIGAEPLLNTEEMKNLFTIVRHGPADALLLALQKTWDTSLFSLRMIGRMITGDVSWRNISGPVTIADYAGQSAQAGWVPYLVFLAIVSISLGVLNLLPVPLLDGGHLMYYVVEIFIGRPVSDSAMEMGQRLGMALLLVLMAFALYNDFNRLFSG